MRQLTLSPSPEAAKGLRAKVRALTQRPTKQPVRVLLGELSRLLRGWGNYFCLGHPRRVFARMDWYLSHRLWGHLRRRSQRGFGQMGSGNLHAALTGAGLLRLYSIASTR